MEFIRILTCKAMTTDEIWVRILIYNDCGTEKFLINNVFFPVNLATTFLSKGKSYRGGITFPHSASHGIIVYTAIKGLLVEVLQWQRRQGMTKVLLTLVMAS